MDTGAQARRDRSRRALLGGFRTGLDAPALLFAGFFEAPIQLRRTSVEASWARVGSYMRRAMSEYGSASLNGSDKRR